MFRARNLIWLWFYLHHRPHTESESFRFFRQSCLSTTTSEDLERRFANVESSEPTIRSLQNWFPNSIFLPRSDNRGLFERRIWTEQAGCLQEIFSPFYFHSLQQQQQNFKKTISCFTHNSFSLFVLEETIVLRIGQVCF